MRSTALTLFSTCFLATAFGQSPLTVDESFNTTFWGLQDATSYLSSVYCDDDKVMVAGQFFAQFGIDSDNCIRRLNEDGSDDLSFSPDLIFSVDFIGQLQKRNDTIYCNNANGIIGRYDEQGSFDLSFTLNQEFCSFGSSYILLEDGKVLYAGLIDPFPCASPMIYNLGRLNADGKLDTTFLQALGSNFDNSVGDIELLSDGRMICAGTFNHFNGNFTPRICRLNTDGTYDPTYQSIFSGEMVDTNTSQFYSIYNIFPDKNGKLIVSGHLLLSDDTVVYPLIRLNEDGSLDTSFNYQSNVGILTNSNGIYGVVTSCLKMEDDGFILGGHFDNYQGISRNCIVKTDSNGHIDLDYFNGTGPDTAYVEVWQNPFAVPFPADISDLVKDNLGRVYVCGRFHKFDGYVRNYIVRLHGLNVGIENPYQNKSAFLYPNPVDRTLHFTLLSSTQNKFTAEVINVTGDVCKVQSFYSNNSVVLDVERLPGGLYLLRISADNQLYTTQKFMISH